MTRKELDEILEKHKRWLYETKDWSEDDRADLRGANLSGANLSEADLREADLREAYLRRADLSGAYLREADLREAYLREADLREADLREADLSGVYLSGAYLSGAYLRRANLSGADLREADLSGADLSGANLSGADLSGAYLSGANLSGAYLREADLREANLRRAKNVPRVPYACPDFGMFIGWKKANGLIVQLEIPEEAKRLSATGRKCRCDKAKVLSITRIDGSESGVTEVVSDYNKEFVYRVGEMVSVENFDEDRWNECSTGIHFFINRQEAVEY